VDVLVLVGVFDDDDGTPICVVIQLINIIPLTLDSLSLRIDSNLGQLFENNCCVSEDGRTISERLSS